MCIAVFVLASHGVLAQAAPAECRTWTSRKGTQMKAALVRQSGRQVVLRNEAGKEFRVNRSALSPADIAYLDGLGAATRASGVGGGTDWPQWRGPRRDGKSTETGLLKSWPSGGPPLLWKKNDIGDGFSGVAVAAGSVYITGAVRERLKLFCYDLSGKTRWTATHGPSWTKNYPGGRATPTVDGDKLYLLGGNGKIACCRVRDGGEVWTREMADFGGRPGGWGYAESLLVHGDSVYASPGRGKSIVALDKKTGRTLWESEGNRGSPHYCSPILVQRDGRAVLIQGNGGGLFAVDAGDGRMLWSSDFSANNTANVPTPAYADNHVVWGTGYGKGAVCMKLASGGSAREAWRTKDLVCHHGGYIIHEGHVYGNNSGGWTCLDLKTGEKKWYERGVGKGSLCYADGMLYTFGEKGGKAGLVSCRPDRFEQQGEFSVEGSGPSWAHPVVSGGRLYLRYASNLYCFDIRGR
jgi:outer membrane protein assembly factor BamB